LAQLGVAEKLRFLPIPHLYRAIAPQSGLDVRIAAGPQEALETLCDLFPHERKGLTRLFQRFFRIQQEIRAIRQQPKPPSIMGALARFPAVSHAATVPLSSLLYRDLSDPLAQLLVGQMWSYFGLPPSQLSALLYAGGLTSYLTHGASYIAGKSQALSQAFASVIEEAGGEVSLGNGAARIDSTSGAVQAVITDGGEYLSTKTVVANANPISVALDLCGRENIPSAFLQRLAAAQPSISTVCVHLGLSRSPCEVGLEDHEVFFNGTTDLEHQYQSCQQLAPPSSFLLTAYNVVDPDFSPPGTAVVTLVALTDGRLWQNISPSHYLQLKEQFASQLVAKAAQLYPELSRHIQVAVVSTPITNMRYTGNVAGAIYGFANTVSENPAFRLEQRGPLAGLWFAGAWTQPGGGFEPTISSGLAAAEAILAERGWDRSSSDSFAALA
jgi:prolycopene isomerase